jgi:hypothetical protein
LRIFENKVLRQIFGLRREEVMKIEKFALMRNFHSQWCRKGFFLSPCLDKLWGPPSLLYIEVLGAFTMVHEVDHSPPFSDKTA